MVSILSFHSTYSSGGSSPRHSCHAWPRDAATAALTPESPPSKMGESPAVLPTSERFRCMLAGVCWRGDGLLPALPPPPLLPSLEGVRTVLCRGVPPAMRMTRASVPAGVGVVHAVPVSLSLLGDPLLPLLILSSGMRSTTARTSCVHQVNYQATYSWYEGCGRCAHGYGRCSRIWLW